jgi:hypothetical protein
MSNTFDAAPSLLGLLLVAAISIIGIRLLSYWWSFLFHWKRYRQLEAVSTSQLSALNVPNIKIQITTRGSVGSTEVIQRGIENVMMLADEAPLYYGRFLSIDIVTESKEQVEYLNSAFEHAAVRVDGLVVPKDYDTPLGTKLKARGLHYAVEQRRAGWHAATGRTFIVHYDEESVMTPGELRKLISVLATTDKKILEGPIYYPLEYMDASVICRAMEANRPIGCYECRHVMENGVPLHLHGSNLVIEEALENEIGWDIGCLDSEPFIAEDYVFGMKAFVTYGRDVFGWHGCVMLEQPPFSFKSAFKQRYRWIFGVLQGMAMIRRNEAFYHLSWRTRVGIIGGTCYRIATFALGAITGVLSFVLMPFLLPRELTELTTGHVAQMPWPTLWLALLGGMWLGSIFIGAWYNVTDAGFDKWQRMSEIARVVAIAPVAGLLECSAGLWAVTEWLMGRRDVVWNPTPKTKQADIESNKKVQLA